MLARLFALLTVGVGVCSGAPVAAQPAAPTNLAAQINGTTVTFSWSAAPAAGVTFQLDAGTSPGLTNAASVVVGSQNTFTVTSVPPGVYYVRARSIVAGVVSGASNEVFVTVEPACAVPPNPPTEFTALESYDRVSIRWTPPVGGCPQTGYLLIVGSRRGAGDVASIPIANVSSVHASAAAGNYHLRLVARNAYGDSTASNDVDVSLYEPSPYWPEAMVNVTTASIMTIAEGGVVVVGEVTNTTNAMLIFNRVTVGTFNRAGHFVGSGSASVRGLSRDVGFSIITDTTLAPGEAGCFTLRLTNVSRSEIGTLRFTASADIKTASPLTGDPRIVSVAAHTTASNQLRLIGEVLNVSSTLTYLNKAVFYTQGRDGFAAGCDFGYVVGQWVRVGSELTNTALSPGLTGRFDYISSAPAPVASIRGWTQWREGQASLADRNAETAIAQVLAAGDDNSKALAEEAWQQLEAERQRAYQQFIMSPPR